MARHCVSVTSPGLRTMLTCSVSLALPDARMQRVVADAVDELRGAVDVPYREIATLAGLERAHAVLMPQCAGRGAGNTRDAFLDSHAEQRRGHVHHEQE